MATLVIKKPTAGDLFIDDLGIIIPGSGQDSFTDPNTIRSLVQSEGLRSLVTAGTVVLNNGTSDLSVSAAQTYLANLWSLGGFDTSPGLRSKYEFGRAIAVPTGGSQQLLGAGSTTAGYRLPRAGTITAASIQVSAIDASRVYNLEVRINGSNVATLALPLSTLGVQTVALAVAVAAGAVLTTFLTRTSGSGASTFSNEAALVEVTE